MKYKELLMMLLENLTREDLKAKYPNIDSDIFNQIVGLDPTSDHLLVGKYTTWLLRMYLRGKLTPDNEFIKRILAKFDKIKDNLERSNVTKYNSIEDLKAVVENESDPEYENHFIDRGSKVVYKDKGWVVEVPTSYHQSCEAYGDYTQWCTASNSYGPSYYNNYTEKGTLYVLRKPEQSKPEAQFLVTDNDIQELQDRHNHAYDPMPLFKKFPGVKEFFTKIAKDYFIQLKNMVNVLGRKFKYKSDGNIRIFESIDISDANITEIPDFANL